MLGLGNTLSGGIVPAAEAAFADDYSILLDGTDDYATAHGAGGVIDGDIGSISVWFKLETTGGSKWLFEFSVGEANHILEVYYHAGINNLRFVHTGGGTGNTITASTTVENNGWHHLVCTWSVAADATVMYIDGNSVGTSNCDDFTGTIDVVRIGYSMWGGGWIGNINDFAIFSDVLTSGEVSTIHNSGDPTDISSHSGLVAYWKFENNATEEINGNSITLVNDATYEEDTP